ncbi:MAG TPA: hypothetical protein VLM38_24095 [Blastocatellia bacterium]|nr:hypothetical protein [Blastocatellia bacterium]
MSIYQVSLTGRLGIIELMLIVAVIALAGCIHHIVSVDEVDRMIKKQAPVASDRKQVKAFIDNLKVNSLKIIRGDFRKIDKRTRPVGSWDPEQLAELWDRERSLSARG